MSNFVGLELLFSGSNIRSKYDAIVCFLHWCMLQNKFKCKGLTEKVESGISKNLSELLPAGWNVDNNLYSLSYQKSSSQNTQDYSLKVLRMDDTLLVHLLRLKDDVVCNTSLETGDFVNDSNEWKYESTFKNEDKLQKQFENGLFLNIIETAQPQQSSTKCSQTSIEDDDTSRRDNYRQHNYYDQPSPFSVGASDLDPFSSRPSGMLMDPFRSGLGVHPLPNRIPRGPPIGGARFDPIGPSMGYGSPSPDHLPPPGFDDMYM